jgi:Tfp pilus assembly protein PilZ
MVDVSQRSRSSPASGRGLRLVFSSVEAFRSEYDRNIHRGGAFIPTQEVFELREHVAVELELAFCEQCFALAAEIVHQVPAEATPPGGQAGVAVEFLEPAPELRERLQPFLALDAEPEPTSTESGGRLEALTDELIQADGCEGLFEPHPALAGKEGDAGSTESPPPEPPGGVERREWPRSLARVAVRVKGPTGGELEGHIRNMSRSGALISIEGSELPVGRSLRLSVSNPSTGRPIEVKGRVTRHVQGEGTVPAVAVRFEPPSDLEDEIGSVVELIRTNDQRLQRDGIRGPIDEMETASLIQMFTGFATRGTLTLIRGVEEATIVFEEGQLRHASAGSVTGVKALTRVLTWQDGEFEFRAHVDSAYRAGKPEPLEGALLEAAQRLDEEKRLSPFPLAAGTRLAIDRTRLAQSKSLTQTEEAVLDLATAGFTVQRILDVIPENDAEIQAAIGSLLERGIVSPIPEE